MRAKLLALSTVQTVGNVYEGKGDVLPYLNLKPNSDRMKTQTRRVRVIGALAERIKFLFWTDLGLPSATMFKLPKRQPGFLIRHCSLRRFFGGVSA